MTTALGIFCGVFLAAVYVLPKLHPSPWWAVGIAAGALICFGLSLCAAASKEPSR